MKGLLFTLTFGLATGGALAQESDADLAKPTSDWRKALNSDYKFAGPASDLPSASSLPAPELFASADVTSVRMAPFIVREPKIDFDSLRSSIRHSEDSANLNEIASKLGIGVHEIKGKHVTLGAVTIFYIPVAFGLKW